MRNKKTTTLIFLSVLLIVSSALNTRSQTTNSLFRHEKFVIRAMRTLHGAEMTYASTYGNGNYGTLAQLFKTGLLAASFESGEQYGYRFELSITPFSTGVPASFRITATPLCYPKTGRRSLYLDTGGEFHGADKNGLPANASDPYIDIDLCALFGGTVNNERCAITDLRQLHGAEFTYASTFGNGNYGTIGQLSEIQIISSQLRDGINHGYSFTVVLAAQTPQNPATFKIYATPLTYGITGFWSYFLNTSGVILGADKHGEPANENDPPINF